MTKGRDHTTLFVGEDEVRIESIAILSQRLTERLDKQLKELDGNSPERL